MSEHVNKHAKKPGGSRTEAAYDPQAQRAARKQLWQLVKAHPGLDVALDFDELTVRHRHVPPNGSPRCPRTDWQAILRYAQSALSTGVKER